MFSFEESRQCKILCLQGMDAIVPGLRPAVRACLAKGSGHKLMYKQQAEARAPALNHIRGPQWFLSCFDALATYYAKTS